MRGGTRPNEERPGSLRLTGEALAPNAPKPVSFSNSETPGEFPLYDPSLPFTLLC